jgi:predicted  nucleic acid-binding Zn-ribbon protein
LKGDEAMAPVQQTNQYQANWTVMEDKANAEAFLSFAEEIPNHSVFGSPSNTNLSFSGSILGVNLKGEVSVLRQDFDGLENHVFNSASYKATFPQQNNMTINLSFNFAQRSLALNLQNTDPNQAALIYDLVKERFPYEVGFTEQELQDKSARITKLLQSAEKISDTAKRTASHEEKIETVLKNVKSNLEATKNSIAETNNLKQEVQNNKSESASILQEAQNSIAELTNLKSQVQADKNTVQQSQNEVGAIESKIKEFFKQIEQYSKKLSEHDKNATAIIKTSEEKTSQIVETNENLQKEIKEHLLKAVGDSLFGAFQKRKRNIVASKWIWAALSAVSLLIQAGAVIWLANEAHGIATPEKAFFVNPMFLLKTTITIPILFLIIFCIRQYGHEREYEELYAFKAALSFSLSPYLDLVKDLSQDQGAESYRDFVVQTIRQVFEDPLPQVKRGKDKRAKDVGSAKDLVDSINKLVGRIIR